MYEEDYDYDDWDYELDWDPDALHKHKKGDKVKWILTSIAFVLMAFMLVGLCLQVFGTGKQKPSEWFDNDEQTETENTVITTTPKLTSTRIQKEQFEYYGIDSQADSAYTVTASISPDNADNKAVTWSIAWSEADTAWSNGKDISEYITLSSTTANPVTVTCKQPFGAQAVITCTSQDNEELTATCTVDYKQKISSVLPKINIGSTEYVLLSTPSLPIANNAAFNVNPTVSVGSIQEEFTAEITVRFSDECIAWLESNYSNWGTGYNKQATLSDGQNFSISYLMDESNPDCLFIPHKSGGVYGSSAGGMFFYQYLLSDFNDQTFPKLAFTVKLTDSSGNTTTYEYKVKLERLTVAAVSLSLDNTGLIF